MIILVKYTSRQRPVKFERGLKSIIDNSIHPELAVVLVSLDKDDPTLPQYMEVIEKYWDKIHIKVKAGESKNKIDAINRDLNDYKAHWDILVNMSDDMLFVESAFDGIIRDKFKTFFPTGAGVLHFNDGNQRENCMTMSIMNRAYYDLFKYIYHNSYESVECDVEAQDVARMLGRYKYMGDELILFKHLHPSFGHTTYDELYNKTEHYEVHNRDKETRVKRKANNYDLVKTEDGKFEVANFNPDNKG